MTLSRTDFKQDIVKYEQRLSKLRQRLKNLPDAGTLKLKEKLQREIRHVEGLRKLAQEALNE